MFFSFPVSLTSIVSSLIGHNLGSSHRTVFPNDSFDLLKKITLLLCGTPFESMFRDLMVRIFRNFAKTFWLQSHFNFEFLSKTQFI